MGEHVEFPGGGGSLATGYLATPDHGSAGPALIVFGSEVGLSVHTTAVCDRFAAEGFTALAPELFADAQQVQGGGAVIGINLSESGGSRHPAIAFLEDHPMVHGKGVGVIGFGLGGSVALATARSAPDDVNVCIPFYGLLPSFEAEDWTQFQAPVQGHFSGQDEAIDPDTVHAFEARLKDAHRPVEVFVYDAAPGFFDEASPAHDPEAAHDAFIRTLSFLRAHLG